MQINYKITYQHRRKGNSKASKRSLLTSSLRFNCSPPRQGHLRILAEKKKIKKNIPNKEFNKVESPFSKTLIKIKEKKNPFEIMIFQREKVKRNQLEKKKTLKGDNFKEKGG